MLICFYQVKMILKKNMPAVYITRAGMFFILRF